MPTFVLIPGAGGDAGYWQLLEPELARHGHRAIAVGIAQDDPTLGLREYADIVEQAIGTHDDVVLVAQSLGGFTAPMVRTPVPMIVLLNAMIPVPGETAGEWWGNTRWEEARRAADEAAGHRGEFDLEFHFLHDLSADARAALLARPPREMAGTAFAQPCEFTRWPDVPIKVMIGADDRFFPAGFQRRVALERLDTSADEIPGGHLVALSNPAALADRLNAYASASMRTMLS
jgi:pimeloyl-ACP methyl ester carboxylesterase